MFFPSVLEPSLQESAYSNPWFDELGDFSSDSLEASSLSFSLSITKPPHLLGFSHRVSEIYDKTIGNEKGKQGQEEFLFPSHSWVDKKDKWKTLLYGLKQGLTPEAIAKYFLLYQEVSPEMISEAFQNKLKVIQAKNNNQTETAILANKMGFKIEELSELKELIERKYHIVSSDRCLPLLPLLPSLSQSDPHSTVSFSKGPSLSSRKPTQSSAVDEVEDIPTSPQSPKSVIKTLILDLTPDVIWNNRKLKWAVLFEGLVERKLKITHVAREYFRPTKEYQRLVSNHCSSLAESVRRYESQRAESKLLDIQTGIGFDDDKFKKLKDYLNNKYAQKKKNSPSKKDHIQSKKSLANKKDSVEGEHSHPDSIVSEQAQATLRERVIDKQPHLAVAAEKIWYDIRSRWEVLFQGLIKDKLKIIEIVEKHFNNDKSYRNAISGHCRDLIKKIRKCTHQKEIAQIQEGIGFEKRNEDFNLLITFLDGKYGKKKKAWENADELKQAWEMILKGLKKSENLNNIQKKHFPHISSGAFYYACDKFKNKIEQAKDNLSKLERLRENETTLNPTDFKEFISLFKITTKRKKSTDSVKQNKKNKK